MDLVDTVRQLDRDWLGVEAPVEQPPTGHPKRPVQGFQCRRREARGRRLWGWAQVTYGTAHAFFQRFLVLNYCPLCFFDHDGGNRTPDRLPRNERDALLEVCDAALEQALAELGIALP